MKKMQTQAIPISLFMAVAPEDIALCEAIDDFLVIFKRHESLVTFHSATLVGGQESAKVLQEQLLQADIILLLVSSHFLASDEIYESQIKRALVRQKNQSAIVLPILLSPCLWQFSCLSHLPFFPTNHQAMNSKAWSSQDEAFMAVAMPIKEAIDRIRKSKTVQNIIPISASSTRAIEAIQSTAAASNKNQLNSFPRPRPCFVGREKELKEVNKNIQKSSIIGIYGVGGIGKTEFAAQYIAQYVKDTSRIIWLYGTSESRFDSFVISCGYGHVLSNNTDSIAQYSAFIDALEQDQMMVFWDNFEQISDPEFVAFLQHADRYLRKATLILLSRVKSKLRSVHINPVYLEGLTTNSAVQYAREAQEYNEWYADVTDEILTKICRQLHGHPLAIELVLQLLHYGEPWENITEKIWDYKDMEEAHDLVHRLFQDLFDHPQMTKAEKKLLVQLSIFKHRADRATLEQVCGGKKILVPLYRLQDKLILTLLQDPYTNKSYYTLIPLIREFAYNLLEEGEQKELHQKAADHFIAQRTEKVSIELEEKIYYHLSENQQFATIAETIRTRGQQILQKGNVELLLDMLQITTEHQGNFAIFNLLYGQIYSIRGDWMPALSHFEMAQNSQEIAVMIESLLETGKIWRDQGKMEEAGDCFRTAQDVAQQYELVELEAKSINLIGHLYQVQGQLAQASVRHEQALSLYQKQKDRNGIAHTLSLLGRAAYIQREVTLSLKYYEKSLKIYEELENKMQVGKLLMGIGLIFLLKRNDHLALHTLKQSLAIFHKTGSKKDIAKVLHNIGLINEMQKKPNQAIEYYKQSAKIKEQIGDNISHASTLENIGVLLYKQSKFNESLIYYYQSLQLFRKINNVLKESDLALNIGKSYTKINQFNIAKNYFQKSLAIVQKTNDQLRLAQLYHNIGICYYDNKSYNDAIWYLLQAYALELNLTHLHFNSQKIMMMISEEIGRANLHTILSKLYINLPKAIQEQLTISQLIALF